MKPDQFLGITVESFAKWVAEEKSEIFKIEKTSLYCDMCENIKEHRRGKSNIRVHFKHNEPLESVSCLDFCFDCLCLFMSTIKQEKDKTKILWALRHSCGH